MGTMQKISIFFFFFLGLLILISSKRRSTTNENHPYALKKSKREKKAPKNSPKKYSNKASRTLRAKTENKFKKTVMTLIFPVGIMGVFGLLWCLCSSYLYPKKVCSLPKKFQRLQALETIMDDCWKKNSDLNAELFPKDLSKLVFKYYDFRSITTFKKLFQEKQINDCLVSLFDTIDASVDLSQAKTMEKVEDLIVKTLTSKPYTSDEISICLCREEFFEQIIPFFYEYGLTDHEIINKKFSAGLNRFIEQGTKETNRLQALKKYLERRV